MLIKQYGKDRNILVAGYVNKGEFAEHALRREVREEIGLNVVSCCFNHSEYYDIVTSFPDLSVPDTLPKL